MTFFEKLTIFLTSGPIALKFEQLTDRLETEFLTIDEKVSLLIKKAELAQKMWIAGPGHTEKIFDATVQLALQAQPRTLAFFAIARAKFRLSQGDRTLAKCDLLGAKRVTEDFCLTDVLPEVTRELERVKDITHIICCDFPYPFKV